MKQSEFVNTMEKVYRSFSKDPDTKQMTIYYEFMKFIDRETFDNCAKQLILTEPFFPPIAKFIDIIKDNIQVPSQSNIHQALTSWMMDSTVRDVDKLSHPVYKMMAEEMGLLDRFSISQEDFDNTIKYRYKRIVEEYRRKTASGEQLRLPESNKRDLYPYANRKQPKRIESGFKKLDLTKTMKQLK